MQFLAKSGKKLSNFDKRRRIDVSREFLKLCSHREERVIRRIVTGDELVLRHSSATCDCPSAVQVPSRSVMTIFWDCTGILNIQYYPHRSSICGSDYALALSTAVASMKSHRDLLLHDNFSVHKSSTVQNLIPNLGLAELQHAPYSPDLSPTDFHIFAGLQKAISKPRNRTLSELKVIIGGYLRSRGKGFFHEGFQRLILRHKLCLLNKGEWLKY